MGAKGSNVQEVTKDWNVNIKFPDRPRQDQKPTSPTVSVNVLLTLDRIKPTGCCSCCMTFVPSL